LLLAVVVFSVPVYLYTQSQPRTFRATTTIFVNQTATAGTVTYSDALLNQQLVMTYSEMAQQPVVLAEVRERLGIPQGADELAAMISVDPVRDTQLFQISATGRSPLMVADLADTTAQVFIEQQARYLPAGQDSSLRVAQPAQIPSDPVGPRPLRNAILAAIIGLLIAGGIVALLEYLDDTIKTPQDMEAAAALATLGAIARQRDVARGASGAGLVERANSRSPSIEAFRLVRTNLDFASIDHPLRALLITSASPGEGKTTIAANLAMVQAGMSRRVILVDGDLRKPGLHQAFGLSNQVGVSNMLLTETDHPLDYLQQTPIEGLRVLTSGPLPPNPTELLSSSRLRALLQRLTNAADLVIIDSPPALAVSDAIIIASRVDGTVVVVDSTRTRAGTLAQVTDALAKSGTRLLGGVLNKISKRSGTYYYYYYSSGGYYGEPKKAARTGSSAARPNRIGRILARFT
jgi:capsular exopolysaccharide synthesis family protein